MLIDNGIVEDKVFDKFYYLKKVFKNVSVCVLFFFNTKSNQGKVLRQLLRMS